MSDSVTISMSERKNLGRKRGFYEAGVFGAIGFCERRDFVSAAVSVHYGADGKRKD